MVEPENAFNILRTIGAHQFALMGDGTILMPMRDGEMERIIRQGGGDFAFGVGGAALKVNEQPEIAVQVAEWRGLLFGEGSGI